MTDLDEKRKGWLDLIGIALCERDRILLDRATRTLVRNICVPEPGKWLPWHPHRGICPSPASAYQGLWNWDSAFHAMAVSRWDRELAYEQVDIFIESQKPDGMFIDVLYADGRVGAEFGKPPVFPWACGLIHKRTGDDIFVRKVYPALQRLESFWWLKRGGEKDGLFFYGGTKPELESGWDNSVRWDTYLGGMENLWPIDLNCYMVTFYRALQYLGRVAGCTGDPSSYGSKERSLVDAIQAKLWDEKAGWYVDTGGDGTASDVLSPASFMPLYTGIAPRERAERMAELAADSGKFFPGMPTVSYDNPKYESSEYWRGPAWLNTTFFALKDLKEHGFHDIADSMRETMLDWCAGTDDALHEYNDTKTGKGIGAPHFGWTTAFLIELILNYGAIADADACNDAGVIS
jgi:putative isomerase